jgi:hypothetical protein
LLGLEFLSDSFCVPLLPAGLAVLADFFPERILLRLQEEYQNVPSSQKERSLETRLKVGEVLMRASRAMGEWTIISTTN